MRRLIELARRLSQDGKAMTSLEYGLMAATISAVFMFGLPALLGPLGLMP